jgi:hypothetical protein
MCIRCTLNAQENDMAKDILVHRIPLEVPSYLREAFMEKIATIEPYLKLNQALRLFMYFIADADSETLKGMLDTGKALQIASESETTMYSFSTAHIKYGEMLELVNSGMYKTMEDLNNALEGGDVAKIKVIKEIQDLRRKKGEKLK